MNKNNVFTTLKKIDNFKTILNNMEQDKNKTIFQKCEIINLKNSVIKLEQKLINNDED